MAMAIYVAKAVKLPGVRIGLLLGLFTRSGVRSGI